MLDAAARKIVQQFFESAKAELASTKSPVAESTSQPKSRAEGNNRSER